jgi:nucleotide-binding universal stress UspA family protein
MRERDPMSIFPTKILLATDGSKEAQLAFASAADLSEKTASELHVVYVGHMPLVSYEAPGATTLDPDLSGRMHEGAEQETRTMLEELVQRVGKTGGEVARVHGGLASPMHRSWDWLMSWAPVSSCWEAGALGP